MVDSDAAQSNASVDWFFNALLPPNLPVWILAEENKCDPMEPPSVFRVMFDPLADFGQKIRILDFDAKKERSHLDPHAWTIRAWRVLTDHGGSFASTYNRLGVTEDSNWYNLTWPGDSRYGTYFSATVALKTDFNMTVAQDVYDHLDKEVFGLTGKHLWFTIDKNSMVSTDLDITSDGDHGDITWLISFLLRLVRFTLTGAIHPITFAVVAPDNCINADHGGKIVIDCKSLTGTLLYVGECYPPNATTLWQKLLAFFKDSSSKQLVFKEGAADHGYTEGWRYGRARSYFGGHCDSVRENQTPRWYIGFNDGEHLRFNNA